MSIEAANLFCTQKRLKNSFKKVDVRISLLEAQCFDLALFRVLLPRLNIFFIHLRWYIISYRNIGLRGLEGYWVGYVKDDVCVVCKNHSNS